MAIIVRMNGDQQAVVPFYRSLSLLDEMDTWNFWKLFEFDYGLMPHTDIYEEKNQLVVKADLPGINKEDLDITIEGDTLTIKAEKKEEVVEDATHHTRERYYGRYFRSLMLPHPVKEDEISATFDNGVLELRLPKADEVETKKIQIKTKPHKGQRKSKKEK